MTILGLTIIFNNVDKRQFRYPVVKVLSQSTSLKTINYQLNSFEVIKNYETSIQNEWLNKITGFFNFKSPLEQILTVSILCNYQSIKRSIRHDPNRNI
jgi:hypothetical protein